MPYTSSHTYLTWGGSIGLNTGEIWQCGLRLAPSIAQGGPPVLPTSAELATLFNGALKTFHQSGIVGAGSGALLRWMKAARVDDEGLYMGEPSIYEASSPLAGSSTAVKAPSQTALVVTLWSGQTFGQANRGRFYVPWAQQDYNPDTGKLIGADQIATAARAFVAGVQTWWEGISPGGYVAIMSKQGTGTTKSVETVRVGDVMDTQRRRRNRLDEQYYDVAL